MSETEARDSEWGLPSAGASRDSSAATYGSTGPGPTAPASSSPSTAAILVVEDDRAARKAISLILSRQGFAVSEVATVAEALAALDRRPDWVLLDIMLPDGDGTAVLRRVVQDGLPSKVCVITGCGPDKLAEVRALGPQVVLTKPLNVAQLFAVLSATAA
jgi:two-component system, OmpR family, KDP operon response regulator KdpE